MENGVVCQRLSWLQSGILHFPIWASACGSVLQTRPPWCLSVYFCSNFPPTVCLRNTSSRNSTSCLFGKATATMMETAEMWTQVIQADLSQNFLYIYITFYLHFSIYNVHFSINKTKTHDLRSQTYKNNTTKITHIYTTHQTNKLNSASIYHISST